MTLAPYSPILFGVARETVSADKLCSKAILKEIGATDEVAVCHFNISKYQFAVANRIHNRRKRALLRSKDRLAMKSVKASEVSCVNFI